ncbi:FAD:protein FMN transferase [bacterium]|nr:FAD:protein FMN transferase [bacterium]
MGTTVSITAVHASRSLAQEAIGRAFEEVDRLVPLLSRHDSASPLFALNRDGALKGAPPELLSVVNESLAYHKLTGGLFDVTIKPVIDVLESEASSASDFHRHISAALSHVGIRNLQVADKELRLNERGMGVTLDGIAKGYIIDRASEVLTRHGVTNHLVNGGGDIRTRGLNEKGRPWTIAVEDPRKHGNYPQVLHLRDGAVATSGRYEIYYDNAGIYHHIVDPRSGICPLQSTSASIVADTVMCADALSTAAFIAAPAAAVKMIDALSGVEAFLIEKDDRCHSTTGWSALQARRG